MKCWYAYNINQRKSFFKSTLPKYFVESCKSPFDGQNVMEILYLCNIEICLVLLDWYSIYNIYHLDFFIMIDVTLNLWNIMKFNNYFIPTKCIVLLNYQKQNDNLYSMGHKKNFFKCQTFKSEILTRDSLSPYYSFLKFNPS